MENNLEWRYTRYKMYEAYLGAENNNGAMEYTLYNAFGKRKIKESELGEFQFADGSSCRSKEAMQQRVRRSVDGKIVIPWCKVTRIPDNAEYVAAYSKKGFNGKKDEYGQFVVAKVMQQADATGTVNTNKGPAMINKSFMQFLPARVFANMFDLTAFPNIVTDAAAELTPPDDIELMTAGDKLTRGKLEEAAKQLSGNIVSKLNEAGIKATRENVLTSVIDGSTNGKVQFIMYIMFSDLKLAHCFRIVFDDYMKNLAENGKTNEMSLRYYGKEYELRYAKDSEGHIDIVKTIVDGIKNTTSDSVEHEVNKRNEEYDAAKKAQAQEEQEDDDAEDIFADIVDGEAEESGADDDDIFASEDDVL